MQEIVIRNNGIDTSVFKNVTNVNIEELQFYYKDTLSTCALRFDFGKLEHIHQHNEASEIWTGKFICVANRSKMAMLYNYTPGRVYEATEKYVYNNILPPFHRGKCYIFSCGDFETLKKEFAKYDIDIIEYKGESLKEERK